MISLLFLSGRFVELCLVWFGSCGLDVCGLCS